VEVRASSFILIILVTCIVLSPYDASSRLPDDRANTQRLQIRTRTSAGKLPQHAGKRLHAAAPVDTFVLADYTFDENGSPSPQGWTLHDQSSLGYRQTAIDTFFHVASGVELDGGQFGRLLPLEGNKSMWCGAAPGALAETCDWATLPGYGNGWIQNFESINFDVIGDVTLSYKVRWDSEPGWLDYTSVEYLGSGSSYWVRLPIDGGYEIYDFTGSLTESLVIPAEAHGGTLKIRFQFFSDGGWSDEDGLWSTDGAVLIDSLTIADSTGVLSFQDFEAEPDGAHRTNDGHWLSTTGASLGQFGALFPGVEALQEDPCVINASHLWGFFSGSPDTYACGGHPEQPAVPFTQFGGIDDPRDLYMDNEIWSPPIDWNTDINAMPIPATANLAFLEFDVYRDLPLDNLVFYTWQIRSVIAGCAHDWLGGFMLFYGNEKDWFRHIEQVAHHVDPNATEVQISLGVLDFCSYLCGGTLTGACHSHAPLFDNVRLIRTSSAGPYWSVNEFDLFQDNFSVNGTTGGTVRMDNANYNGRPYDSEAVVSVFAPDGGIDWHIPGDTLSGPAVYCHVKDVSAVKSGNAISEDLEDYPVVETDAGWTVLRCLGPTGDPWMAQYSVGLNDYLYTPGDTVYYYFSARDSSGVTTYWSLPAGATTDEADVVMCPNEVTCLPANALSGATDILYVDNYDNLGAQPFFESAFEALGLTPDRYDILAPMSTNNFWSNNGPGSRVVNVTNQLISSYRKIIWNSGDLRLDTIGDGARYSSDDFALLFTFLDQHPNGAGLYLSGNSIAEEWITSTQASAMNLRDTYFNFNVINGAHTEVGEAVSPLVIGMPGSCFDRGSEGLDMLIAYAGGCSGVNGFDVLEPYGPAQAAMVYAGDISNAAVVTQVTENSVGNVARVILSGFSFHNIRDYQPGSVPARVSHLEAILEWLGSDLEDPVLVDDFVPPSNSLGQNYPNPFNPTTTINYSIKEQVYVTLKIYNVAGQLVKTLVNEKKAPGLYTIQWNGENNTGDPVGSGVYFYRMVTKDFSQTRKLILMK
jgi:hypothetical protein